MRDRLFDIGAALFLACALIGLGWVLVYIGREETSGQSVCGAKGGKQSFDAVHKEFVCTIPSGRP